MSDQERAPEQQPPARRRGDPGIRVLRQLTLGGLASGVALAGIVGLIGGTGRDGMAVFLLIAALTSSLIGLVGVITMARDDHRDIVVVRGRIVFTVCGFLGATLLMAMLVGIGG